MEARKFVASAPSSKTSWGRNVKDFEDVHQYSQSPMAKTNMVMSLDMQLHLYFGQPFFVGLHLGIFPSKAPSRHSHLHAVGEELQI